jgi:hypothetical protein
MSVKSRRAWFAKNRGQQVIAGGTFAANGSQEFSGSGRPSSPIPVVLNVSGSSGTSPTLNVVVEQSVDGTTWTNKATFAQRTGAGSETLTISPPYQDRLRVRWTIGGSASPTFTFSVALDFERRQT